MSLIGVLHVFRRPARRGGRLPPDYLGCSKNDVTPRTPSAIIKNRPGGDGAVDAVPYPCASVRQETAHQMIADLQRSEDEL